MKKRLIPMLLIFFLLASFTSHAAVRRTSGVTPSISFSGTTATCSVRIFADKTTDSIDAAIQLWEGNTCIATWNESAKGYLRFSGTASVKKGKSYELTVNVSINGASQSLSSGKKTCP